MIRASHEMNQGHSLHRDGNGADSEPSTDGLRNAIREAAEDVWATPVPVEDDPAQVGPFKILGRLGAGAMGIVYRAQQENPSRIVALKVIRPGVVSARSLRRFRREEELMARLTHPGIARLYAAELAADESLRRPYFVMELVEGPSLIEYVRREGLDLRDRVELIARVCDAVEYAHQKGVIHRDLKPANILVVGSGPAGPPNARMKPVAQPKILDFGVACAVNDGAMPSGTRTSQIVGTVPYMSPEQLSGDPLEVDTRSDVYALGVMLYEVLTGRLPYDVAHLPPAGAAQLIAQSTPPLLMSGDKSLRGDLTTIVRKALASDRALRYQSAGALADDLRRFLRGEAIVARMPGPWYLLRKALARHKLQTCAACAILVLGCLTGVAMTLVYQRTLAENTELHDRNRAAEQIVRELRPDPAGPDATRLRGALAGFNAEPVNLSFEHVDRAGDVPAHWWFAGGSTYALKLEASDAVDGHRCSLIASLGQPDAEDSAALNQVIRADGYRGRRVRLSGKLRTDDVHPGWAGFWMRIDGDRHYAMSFDNLERRGPRGTTAWREYEIVLDVAPNASAIYFGTLLVGPGRVWIDGLRFETVDLDRPTTNAVHHAMLAAYRQAANVAAEANDPPVGVDSTFNVALLRESLDTYFVGQDYASAEWRLRRLVAAEDASDELKSQAMYYLIGAIGNQGRSAEALKWADRYLNKYPGSDSTSFVTFWKGVFHQRLGETSEAAACWQSIVDREPSDEMAEHARLSLRGLVTPAGNRAD